MDVEKIEKIELPVGSADKEPIAIAIDIDPRMSHSARVKQARATVKAFAAKIGIEHLPSSIFSNNDLEEKPCLNCKELHTDPRGFCSPKCCKNWVTEKTAERKELKKHVKNSRSRNSKNRR